MGDELKAGMPHEYGPSRVGHGEAQCIHCLGTNRENAIIAPNVCPRRTDPRPAPVADELQVEQVDRDAEIRRVWAAFVNCEDDSYFGIKTKMDKQLEVLRGFEQHVLARQGAEQGPPCPNCNIPVSVGQLVLCWDDAGEMHVDCSKPYALDYEPGEGDPPPVVLLGSPMRHVPLAALATRSDPSAETWGFDKWQASGLPSERAYIEDMANVGEALMEALPEGYSYCDCPSEIVTDLLNERDEAKATSDELVEVLKAADHYAKTYLQDERDEPVLCVDQAHHKAVCDLFAALSKAGCGGQDER